MYPKNSATPPEVDLGQILLIADGTVQTSGASVRVKIGGGAWAAGAGVASCDATSGIWTYAPTQAETNAAYFIVALFKANCTAVSKTIVTTASSNAGYAGLDWSQVTAPSTSVNLTNTTISPTQVIASVTSYGTLVADIRTAVWGASVRSLTTFGSLASDVWSVATRTLTAVTDSAGVATLLTRVVGTLSAGTHVAQSGDSYARLGPSVMLGQTLAMDLDYIYGGLFTRMQDLWETQVPAIKTVTDKLATMLVLNGAVYRYTAGALALGPGLDAAGTRAAVGLAFANLDSQLSAIDDAIDTEVGAIKTVTDQLATMLVLNGAVYRYTAEALALAPAGGGGSVDLTPVLNELAKIPRAGAGVYRHTSSAGTADVTITKP